MKEKIMQYGNDTAVGFSSGVVASESMDNNNQLVVLIVSAVAPIIRDLAIKAFTALFRKKAKTQQP